MNRYGITINNHPESIQHASRAYTAVRNAMARLVEGEFKPYGHIKVRFIDKVAYTYDLVADVPFDYRENGKGTTRKVVQAGIPCRRTADIEMQKVSAAHSDWKFIRVVRRIK